MCTPAAQLRGTTVNRLMAIDLPHDSRILLLAMRAASITPTR
jgi:hypothetical protein